MKVIALTPFQRFLRIPDPGNFCFRNPKSIGKFSWGEIRDSQRSDMGAHKSKQIGK